jgi:peptide/nickel transport system permease protein
MTAYIIRRLIQAIITLILVSILVFFAMRVLPGDPVYIILTAEQVQQITPEEVNAIKKEYGLDKPLPVQYINWIRDMFRGDLGTSIRFDTDVTTLIAERIPVTFHLGIVAFILGTLVGVLAGIISAMRRGSWLDTVVTVLANIGITVPVFWLGIMMIYVFALYLKVLPVLGYTSPFEDFWMSTKQIIMPVICLGVMPTAAIARQTRSSLLEVLQQDYIRTAWSKGLRERVIIFRHALKNSLIPVITLVGLGISSIFGGSVLIETVFNIPGMGQLAVNSILRRDYMVAQSVTLLMAFVVIIANMVIDLSYGWIDPRIRYR